MNKVDEKTIQQIKEMLESEQTRLLGLLERTHAHRHRSEPLSADFSEQATETENDQVVEVLDREGKFELSQINNALKKIDDGSYGQCAGCGTDIQQARLLTIPETDFCIECARQRE